MECEGLGMTDELSSPKTTDELIADFIAKGGKITKLPDGLSLGCEFPILLNLRQPY
jgi:hypothetical protein